MNILKSRLYNSFNSKYKTNNAFSQFNSFFVKPHRNYINSFNVSFSGNMDTFEKLSNEEKAILRQQRKLKEKAEKQAHYESIQKRKEEEKINQLHIKNIRILSPNLVSGETFSNRSDLSELKSAGIDTMIDLRDVEDAELQKKCINSRINYLQIPLTGVVLLNDKNYFYRGKDKSLHAKKEFIEALKIMFNAINSSNCYMACQYGIDRTNIGILLNYFLNKDYNGNTPKILCWDFERLVTKTNQDIKLIKKLYKAMDDSQKAELGILNLEETDSLKNKIYKLKSKNHS